MTIVLLTVFIFVTAGLLFSKQIRKLHYGLYVFAGIIALVIDEANIISLGYVPFGIFLVVMFTGALDKGIISKKFNTVRAEYAIIGFIMLLPHALGYLLYFLDEFSLFDIPLSFYPGVIATLVFIPLTITSFRFIRKLMKYQDWKKVHRYAYLGYSTIFLHLLLIDNERFYMYLGIYITYVILRIPDMIKYYKKIKAKKAIKVTT